MGILEGRKAELAQGVDPNRSDLLTLMLTAKDPRTGRMLPEENIVNQILTFLFVG
jgi:cytochrome P450